MNLDTDTQQDPGQAPTRQALEDEYRRLLSCQKIDELRAAARRWGVRIKGSRKSAIAGQLAAWLSDPNVIRAHIGELDDLGLDVLTYLHLTLAPDYGMDADNVVRGMIRQREHAHQQAQEGGLQPAGLRPADASSLNSTAGKEYNAAIQGRIATLNQQGLLVPFRQKSATYYSLPTAVRFHLPARPELFGGPHQNAALLKSALTIRETTIGQRVQTLYAIWMAIAGGSPGAGAPLSRQAFPPRKQIEDTWVSLKDWNNDPDEIANLEAGLFGRRRSGSTRLNSLSIHAVDRSLTVVAPPRRLSDDDLAFVRKQTGRPAPEIEFCYVLLEALGTLSGDPGQPVSIHKKAMYRFLRESSMAKVRTLWQAWTTSETWSEMEAVLRAAKPDTVRLRRSMVYPDFRPADLYGEWNVARQAVLRFLALLDEDRWVSIDGFLQAVYTVHPDLLHSRTDSAVWRIESPRTGKQFGTTIEDWLLGHGRFVKAMLQGPLYWLGFIRLGYSSAESLVPQAFQLTPTGAYALGKRAAFPLEAPQPTRAPEPEHVGDTVCSVTDDLTITLFPGRAPAELYDLVHAVGDLIEAAPDRFVYRLTASRVLSWAEAAAHQSTVPQTIEMLIAALSQGGSEGGAQRQVAAPWQRKLRAWGQNYGQLHIYENLTLIELTDEYALQELLVSTSLREHIVHQFSPHLVAIQDDAVDQLVQDMERRGYTPRVK